jgi:hypothetical protein
MGAAHCWNCDYPLEGLAPGPSGLVTCPECSLEQTPGKGPPGKPRKGYFVGLVISVVVQAVCLVSSHHLWALARGEGSLSYQFAGVLLLFAPVIGAAAATTAIMLARRRQKPGLRLSQWRTWGLFVAALCVNVLVWVALAVITFMAYDNGTLMGF